MLNVPAALVQRLSTYAYCTLPFSSARRHATALPLRLLVGLTALVTLLWSAGAQAQVNTEAMLSDGRSDPWSIYADFSVSLKRGNTDSARSTIGAGGRRLTLFDDPNLPVGGEPWFRDRFMVSGSWAIEQSRRVRTDHVGFLHARWTRMWIPKVGHEIFAQGNYAEFNRVNRRLLLGGGVRVVVFNDSLAQFWFGTGLFAEEEDFDLSNVEDAGNYPSRRLNARWSSYATLKVNAFDQKIIFTNTLYAQPTLADLGDIRVLYEGRLTARIYKSFAISFNSTINYDSTPVPGVRRTDIRFGGALQFRLYGNPVPTTPVHVGPSELELKWLAMAEARPVIAHRVDLALQQARTAVQSEMHAREQRRNVAIAEASALVERRRAYATQRANTAPAGTRNLAAYQEPNAHAAMEAAFVTTSLMRSFYRWATSPTERSRAGATPKPEVPVRQTAPDDGRGLFVPVIE